MICVVDTHCLLWYISHSQRLGTQAESTLDTPESALVVPAIVLAEIQFLWTKGRVQHSAEQVVQWLDQDDRCSIEDITWSVVRRMPEGLEMHDALICAMALNYQDESDDRVVIVSRDLAIREWGRVETIW